MTTIAFRDGIMVSDSQETVGDVKHKCKKLFRKKNLKDQEVILGTAGTSFTGMIYVDLFGTDAPRPVNIDYMDIDEDFHILIWDGRRLFEVNWMWRPIEVPRQKFFAIGTGAAAALGAMHMGATAREAVGVARKIDLYTSGRIQVMSL